MDEWALVFFTVFSQMAAGALLTVCFLDQFQQMFDQKTGTFLSQGIALLLGASLLISLGHLGHPLEAYRALTHLSTSWLSREVAVFGALFALTIIYAWRWQTGQSRQAVGYLSAVVAVIAVAFSGLAYALPARPAWNNAGPLVFFFLTSFSLGPLLVVLLARRKQCILSKSLFIFVAAALGSILITLAVYITMLLGGGGVLEMTGRNLLESGVFWLRLFAGLLIPLGLLGFMTRISPEAVEKYLPILFVLVLLGEILGRELFYSSVVALTMFGV